MTRPKFSEKINKFGYVIFFRVFIVILTIFTLCKIIQLSRQVRFEDVYVNELSSIGVEIDLCYPLDLNNNNTIDGETFDCNFQKPVAYFSKDFREKPPNEIIKIFKGCKIESLATVVNSKSNDSSTKISHLLFSGQICVKHKFEIENSTDLNYFDNGIEFKVESEEKIQNFDIYLSITRNQNGDVYKSTKKHLIRRSCWSKNEANECLETGRSFNIEVLHFVKRSLKSPYVTNCLDRKQSDQNDCFEECVKNENNHYLLTFNETEEKKLNFSDYESMQSLNQKCSNQCDQPDCLVTILYTTTISENKFEKPVQKDENNSSVTNDELANGLFIIEGKIPKFGIDSEPYFEKSKTVWLFFVCLSVFFGIDVYGLFLRSTKMYDQTVDKKKKNIKKKSKKRVIFSIIIFAISLSLALVCEKALFNFGNNKGALNRTYFSEIESIVERNVSVSVCFDPISILKTRRHYDNETLLGMSLKELDEVTWDDKEFKSHASLKNAVRYVPIRDDSKEIPVFYRNFKKCFLINYDTRNVYPHLPLQRKSFIHLTIDGAKFDHFYLEDGSGYIFPKIKSKSASESVLHKVEIFNENGECTDYSINYRFMTRKNDFVQECLIRKYVEQYQALPSFLNLKIHKNMTYYLKISESYFNVTGNYLNMTENYLDLKFKNDTYFNESLFKECEIEVNKKECQTIETKPTNYDILAEGLGDPGLIKPNSNFIVVNLTPFLFESKVPLSESKFIVFNRIITFVTMFTCFSVANAVKNFVSTYLYSLATLYNFQFVNRLAYLFVFLFFLINLGFLMFYLTNPMTETYSSGLAEKIRIPRFRICYEHDITKTFVEKESLTSITLEKDLDQRTLNFSELVKKIVLINEDNSEKTILFDQGDYENITKKELKQYSVFYVDNLKCFNFEFEKTYDAKNRNVQKLTRLVEIHINVEKTAKRRVFIFLNDVVTLDLDFNKPYYNGNKTINYLTREFAYEDDFWIWKNLWRYLKHRLNIKKLNNNPAAYLDWLSWSFGEEQYSATTSVLLHSAQTKEDFRRNLPIKNRQVRMYL